MNKLKSCLSVKLLTAVLLYVGVLFLMSSCINPLGEIVGTSEITVIHDGKTIVADSVFSFGEVIAGAEKPVLTFLIKNQGKSTLSLPTGVIISGENASMFSIPSPPVVEIEPKEESKFSLAFNPSGTGGLKKSTASIETNDKLIKTFSITVQGTFTGVSVYITTTESNPTNNSSIPINVTFSESIEGFTSDDFVITNGTVESYSFQPAGANTWSVKVNPVNDGLVMINIPEGAVFSSGTTHTNIAAQELRVFFDGNNPTGDIKINDGAGYTNSLDVLLALTGLDGTGTGVKEMMIANDSGFTDADWESFSSSKFWALKESAVEDEELNVYVRFRDYAGNESRDYHEIVIYDTMIPPSPSIPDLAAEDDSGTSDIDNETSQSTALTFTGTAEAYAIIELYSDIDGLIGSSSADGSGEWSIDADLSSDESVDIVHVITVTATDRAGNAALFPSGELVVTIQPPNLEYILVSDSADSNILPGVPVILAGDTVQLYAYGELEDEGGTIDITALVTWTSMTPELSSVNTEGHVTGLIEGLGIIKAGILNNDDIELSDEIDINIIASGDINIGLE